MKKTGLVRFLCLLVCVMMAAGAIGAGKPVVSVQTDDAGRLLFDGTNPGAPDPETSEEPEESAEPEPSSETEEPTDAGESAEPVNGEPLVFLYGDVPYGTGTETDSDYDGIPDEYDADPENNSFTGDLKSGHKDNTTSVGFTVDFRDFFDNNTVYHPNLATFSVMGAALAYMGRNSTYDNAYFVFSEAPVLNSTGSKVDGAGLMETFGFRDVKDYTLDSYGDDSRLFVIDLTARPGYGWNESGIQYNFGENRVNISGYVYEDRDSSDTFSVGDGTTTANISISSTSLDKSGAILDTTGTSQARVAEAIQRLGEAE